MTVHITIRVSGETAEKYSHDEFQEMIDGAIWDTMQKVLNVKAWEDLPEEARL